MKNDKELKIFFQTVLSIPLNGNVEIRAISPEGEVEIKFFNSFVKCIKFINKFHETHHIYFGVSLREKRSKKGKKENCEYVNCLWMDIDFKDKGNENSDEVLSRLKSFRIPPTIIISSGNGLHGYWIFKEPIYLNNVTVPLIEILNKGLERELNGDNVSDISRILRVPFTKNLKNPNDIKEVSVIELNEKRYEISDFDSLERIERQFKEIDWKIQEMKEDKILELVESLPPELKKSITKNDGFDRSKFEFGIVFKLIKEFMWSPSEVYKLMWMDEFKEGIGKKTQEENRDDYCLRTINRALEIIEDENVGINYEGDSVLKNLNKPFNMGRFKNIFFEESSGDYMEVNKDSYRYLTKDEFKRILSATMFRIDHEGNKVDRDLMVSNYLLNVNSEKVIKEIETKTIPFGQTNTNLIKQNDGKFRLKIEVSLLEHLQDLKVEYEKIEIPNNFTTLISDSYLEVVDVFLGALARKFCGNKKSNVWLHCNSNYGKTYLFDIKGVSLKFDGEINLDDLKGDDPIQFGKLILFFIDEAYKFPKELKSDSFLYRGLYSGLKRLEKPLVLLASANPIKDFERGTDKQIRNRVTKILIDESYLNINLAEINLTPQSARLIYEKFIIELLINKILEWKNQYADYVEIASEEFDSFLKKYELNLDQDSLEDILVEEVEDYINEEIETGDTGPCTQSEYIGIMGGKFKSRNLITPFSLYILKPQSFLENVIYKRIGDKKYTMSRMGISNKAFGEIFSEYKNNRMKFKTFRSVEINYEYEDQRFIIIRNNEK